MSQNIKKPLTGQKGGGANASSHADYHLPSITPGPAGAGPANNPGQPRGGWTDGRGRARCVRPDCRPGSGSAGTRTRPRGSREPRPCGTHRQRSSAPTGADPNRARRRPRPQGLGRIGGGQEEP